VKADCIRVRLHHEIDVSYINYMINAPQTRSRAAAFVHGVGRPRLNLNEITSMALLIAPRSEQVRIVAEVDRQLSRVNAGADALQRARRNLRRMRKTILNEATLGRLVPQEPSDEPGSILLKRVLEARRVRLEGSEHRRGFFGQESLLSGWPHKERPTNETEVDFLPALPPSWVWARLDQLADVVGGVTKDTKRQADPAFVEVPYLRVANVQRGFLDLGDVATIRVPADKAAALRLRRGDILFTEGGDRDKLGRGWVWEGQIDECIHQNHVFRARLYSTELEPRFISWHGNTFGRAWFEAAGKQTTNLASISLTTLKSLPVPVPPAAEQQRIAAEVERQLSLIEASEAEVERGLEKAVSLRRAILQAAFEGRLVPQDPEDEPAAVLLERIAAARASEARARSSRAEQGKLL